MKLQVETLGKGSRVVLVHGGMGYPNWSDQKVLAEHFQLELLTRPGYPPNPPESVMGFDIDAKLVAEHLGDDGAHLVGHSYGGIVCLLAADLRPNAVLSLTVTEPPCFDVARGQAEVEDYMTASDQLYASNIQDPGQFLIAFMEILGLPFQLQEALSPVMQQLVEGLMIEKGPWEAQIPLAELRATPFPKLVVSGAMSHPALIAVSDVLEHKLSAQRVILPDTDHRIMHSPDFNGVLEDFLTKAA